MTTSRGAWMTVVMASAALLASCSSSPSSSAPSPSSGSGASASPVASVDERELVTGRLSCGDGDTFAAAALNGPGGAELSSDPAAAALRTAISDSTELPRAGWHLVAASSSRAQFVARGSGEEPWLIVAVVNGANGWTVDVAGGCRLQVVLGPGLDTAVWWTDPATPVDATTTRFTAVVQERTCASGRPPDGRIAAPAIVYAADSVLIVFATVPLPGGQDCPGAPPGRYDVTLKEPLGNRALLDGGLLPPRDATKPPA